MSNTLRPDEGNNWYIHHPYNQPYPSEWMTKGINPYHKEQITDFSHQGCLVKVVVDVLDNDMGFLLGKQSLVAQTDTFNLKDVDATTIRIADSCEPFDTPEGKQTPFNCEDDAGLQMEFRTQNAQKLIHREEVGSGYKSAYGEWEVQHVPKLNPDAMCKEFPGNPAYCDFFDKKYPSLDLSSDALGFYSPEYTTRFVQAFRHAVELCGGKPSTF